MYGREAAALTNWGHVLAVPTRRNTRCTKIVFSLFSPVSFVGSGNECPGARAIILFLVARHI